MTQNRNSLALAFVCALTAFNCIVLFAAPRAAAQTPQELNPASLKKSAPPLDDHQLSSALCSIVYQVDRDPEPRGYHYLFYGNGFFINSDGYLITAAYGPRRRVLCPPRSSRSIAITTWPSCGPRPIHSPETFLFRS